MHILKLCGRYASCCWVVVALLISADSVNIATPPRSVSDISNPMKEPEKCGQKRPRSNICDPDGIISEEQAMQLDGRIQSIYNGTTCPCEARICRQAPGGYKIGIAMVKNMLVNESVRVSENSAMYLDKMLNEAKLFAYNLLIKWNMGRCREDVLIFYSVNDHMMYTMTNTVARKLLIDEIVGQTWMETRILFDHNPDHITDGFMQVLSKYNDTFWSKTKRTVQSVLNDDFQTSEMQSEATSLFHRYSKSLQLSALCLIGFFCFS